jgi:hypothetical protein
MATILIYISIIVLVYIILNEYKIKNMNINNTEEFYSVGRGGGSRPGGGGSRPGGGGSRLGGGGSRLGGGGTRLGGGRGYSRNYHNNYYGGGRGGYFWRRPYYRGWNDWYPFYSYYNDYDYSNYYTNWRVCPQGTWCPPYLSCNDPNCI